VGERHRKDLGEIGGLAASIAAEGLLQPIGITEQNVLVFGERRLRAFQDVLRRETIPARVVHVPSITAGEYAENEIRKDFTPSERVAIGKALEAELGDRRGQRTDVELRENFPEVEQGRTEEIAARKAGFGNYKTYEQAKKVVEKAVDEVIAQMDSEQIAVSAAAVIADETPERQREIAAMPPPEQREVVRKLRRKDLPTPAEAHRRAKETGMAILDRNLEYQLPMSMDERRPLIERNLAVMAVIDATRDIAKCPLMAADVAAGILEFDTPDMDFVGRCRKAALFLSQIEKELNA
jgi:ParB-like chromosome segregation protein Spo0J